MYSACEYPLTHVICKCFFFCGFCLYLFGFFETGSFVIPSRASFKPSIMAPQTTESRDCGSVTLHLVHVLDGIF